MDLLQLQQALSDHMLALLANLLAAMNDIQQAIIQNFRA